MADDTPIVEPNYFKMLLYRFLRGFVAGAAASMVAVPVIIKSAGDIISVFALLGYSALAGGITGGLLALDKYIRTE